MPKRNTAIDAIDTMNASTLAANEAKTAELSKIPMPTIVSDIRWDSVVSDHNFNVRDESSYSFDTNKELYKSLKELGLQVRGGDNMSFSHRDDDTLLVLTGNLRYWIMKMIREEESERRAESGEPTNESNPLPFQTIFGTVFYGLSREQEIALMADHTMKKGLTEFELCKEIGEFMEAYKLTDAKAAVKFGIDKNKIARMRMRYAMPTVFAEYRKEKGKDKSVSFITIGQVPLQTLYTAYLSDRESGCSHREEGINFRKAWAILLANPEAFKPRPAGKVGSKERDVIVNQANAAVASFGNNPEVSAMADILAWAANEERDGQPIKLQLVQENLITYVNGLRDERDSLRDLLESAANDANEARESLANLTKDYDGLTAEVTELRAENEKLKARKPKA